jgi:hypothetical protein
MQNVQTEREYTDGNLHPRRIGFYRHIDAVTASWRAHRQSSKNGEFVGSDGVPSA